MKLIIWISGRPILNGYKRRDFEWSEKHKSYIYLGRELLPHEFNAAYDKAAKTCPFNKPPHVKVVGLDEPATITTITAAHEVTAEEAEAVILRLAPERLKAKPGRKTIPAQEAVG